jgi:aminoglycoside phosphotransferase (APT) family kinase protein
MMPNAMPPAEVDIDEELVRRLLADQHRDLADLPMSLMANGWDNVMFRLGDDLVARLPRREAAAALVLHEQRWLPMLAPDLPLPIPAPVRAGHSQAGYPWSWSVIPFMPGDIAARTEFAGPHQAATALGGFLRALHTEASPDAPANPVRGIPLARRQQAFEKNLATVEDRVDADTLRGLWTVSAKQTPRWAGPPLWLHGDLHAANILVHDGAVSGVIDFGDITGGDPATDLSIAWSVIPAVARDTFWAAYGKADDATRARAHGWAVAFAVVYLAHSADNPMLEALGRRTYQAVIELPAEIQASIRSATACSSAAGECVQVTSRRGVCPRNANPDLGGVAVTELRQTGRRRLPARGQHVHPDRAAGGQRRHLLVEPVPPRDLERDQPHLPRPGGHRQRALDPAHLEHVDDVGAQRHRSADRDRVDQPSVEEVLAVHVDRRQQPRYSARRHHRGHDGPAAEPARGGILDGGRHALEGQR